MNEIDKDHKGDKNIKSNYHQGIMANKIYLNQMKFIEDKRKARKKVQGKFMQTNY